MIETINPENEQVWLEARLKDVTSTEVSALFGISPYMTPFELWHRKKDAVVVRLDPNERMFWGTKLQDAIATAVAEEQGWKIRRMTEYMRDTEVRMGASFDFDIGDSFHTDQRGLLEIKNVDGLVFLNEWTNDEKGLQAPLHIEIQVQQELACSGRGYCYLCALVGGNRLEKVKRTRDEAVIQAIKNKVADFWASIEANTPPPPDFQADAEFIGKLFGYAEPGKVLNVVENAEILNKAVEYRALGETVKSADARREAIKAELLTMVGDAEKIIGAGFSIDAGITSGAHVEYDRAPFRRFKVSWKKEKKA